MVHLDQVELPALGVVAADNGLAAHVPESDPQTARGVPGELPGPLHGRSPRARMPVHGLPLQIDDSPLPRRQPRPSRRVGGHVVHRTDGPAGKLGHRLHAPPLGKAGDPVPGQHLDRAVRLGVQAQDVVGGQSIFRGVHLKPLPVEGGQTAPESPEQQAPVLVFGDGHRVEMGKPVRGAEGLEPGPVEAADPAVRGGHPQEPPAVLVDVSHVHPAQPVEDRVLAPEHMIESHPPTRDPGGWGRGVACLVHLRLRSLFVGQGGLLSSERTNKEERRWKTARSSRFPGVGSRPRWRWSSRSRQPSHRALDGLTYTRPPSITFDKLTVLACIPLQTDDWPVPFFRSSGSCPIRKPPIPGSSTPSSRLATPTQGLGTASAPTEHPPALSADRGTHGRGFRPFQRGWALVLVLQRRKSHPYCSGKTDRVRQCPVELAHVGR